MDQSILRRWQRAGITNDFIFGNVMQMGNNCRDLLRAILPINTQKDIRDQHDQRGVRLDVFAEDENERVYDVEMQVTQQKDLGERIRYYQSKIDMDSLTIGNKYEKIKESYVIFLCPFDPIGIQLRRYTLELHINEKPSIKFATGAKVLLLNSVGKAGKITPELSSFFGLMNGVAVQDNSFGKQIEQDIAAVKRDPIKERDFMDLAWKMRDARQEGLEQGLKQGQVEGQAEGKLKMARSFAKNLKSQGYSANDIQKQLKDYFSDQLSDKEIDSIVADLR